MEDAERRIDDVNAGAAIHEHRSVEGHIVRGAQAEIDQIVARTEPEIDASSEQARRGINGRFDRDSVIAGAEIGIDETA